MAEAPEGGVEMSMENRMTKYIFVTGGVMSSLGKGLASAVLIRGYCPGILPTSRICSQLSPSALRTSGATPAKKISMQSITMAIKS